MRPVFRLPHLAAACLPAIAFVSLAACHEQEDASASETAATGTPAAQTAATPAVAISGAMLRLPVLKDHPGVAYFTLTNSGKDAITLTGAAVDGTARAELHETIGDAMMPLPSLAVAPGGTANFAPGGKHVMVFGIGPFLTPGATGTITLSFADGSKLSAPLKVQAATGDGDMSGMKM